MRTLSLYERHRLREVLGDAVRQLMNEFDLPEEAGDFGPYLIAELMSLSVMLARGKMPPEKFLEACKISVDEEWCAPC